LAALRIWVVVVAAAMAALATMMMTTMKTKTKRGKAGLLVGREGTRE
jgi:hypothetical protein